jgi:CubicO group peptidase (beta-lactamase class C family)
MSHLSAPKTFSGVLGSILSTHIDLCGAPRAAAAVVNVDGSVLADWGRDASPSTVFRVASMTKSFTAAALLLLRDRGELHLDMNIGDADPLLSTIVGPGADPAPISLRHLVTMSSGLATDDPWADRHLDATDADLDSWIRSGLRFAHPTGTAFEYSNLGYALIGRVIHLVTGRRLQDIIREDLLSPLGMTTTAWSTDQLPSDADIADGWHRTTSGVHSEPRLGDGVIAPMGGLWTTTADLSRWVSYLSSAFTPSPRPGPLRAASRREMQQGQRFLPVRPRMGPDGGVRVAEGSYAMGLTVFDDERLGQVVTHSGGLPGYGSNMRWIPGGTGVIALANVTYAPMWFAGAAVLDALGVSGLISAIPADNGEAAAIRHIGTRLIEFLRSGVDPGDLFADNVAMDRPLPEYVAEAQERFGGQSFTLANVAEISGASGRATVAEGNRLHAITFELWPVQPARIQAWNFS